MYQPAFAPVFDKRGLLLDAGTPWLPLATLAGYRQDMADPDKSVPGGGVVAGIGFVFGVRCMVVASDSSIEAGAIQPMGLDKILRLQEIALQNKLSFLHLVGSAGANLMRYRVEGFVRLSSGTAGTRNVLSDAWFCCPRRATPSVFCADFKLLAAHRAALAAAL